MCIIATMTFIQTHSVIRLTFKRTVMIKAGSSRLVCGKVTVDEGTVHCYRVQFK